MDQEARKKFEKIVSMAKEYKAKADEKIKKFNDGIKKGEMDCQLCRQPHCCNQITPIFLYEAALIAHFLVDNHTEKTHRLLETGALQEEYMEKNARTIIYDGVPMGAQGASLWFVRQQPCEFLVFGKCQIYDIRPATCATYWVPKSSRTKCGSVIQNPDDMDGGRITADLMTLDMEFTKRAFQLPGLVFPRSIGAQVQTVLALIMDERPAFSNIPKSVIADASKDMDLGFIHKAMRDEER